MEDWIVSPDGTQRARLKPDGVTWEYQTRAGPAPDADASAASPSTPAPTQGDVPPATVEAAPASPQAALERRFANPPPKQPTPSTQEQTTARSEGLADTKEKTEKIYDALVSSWAANNRTDMGGTGIGEMSLPFGMKVGPLGRNALDAAAAQMGAGHLRPGFGNAHPRQRTFGQMRNDRGIMRSAGTRLLSETMRSGERGEGATGTMLDSQTEFQNWMSMFPSPTNPNMVNRENTRIMINDLNRLRRRHGWEEFKMPGSMDDPLPPGAIGEGEVEPQTRPQPRARPQAQPRQKQSGSIFERLRQRALDTGAYD